MKSNNHRSAPHKQQQQTLKLKPKPKPKLKKKVMKHQQKQQQGNGLTVASKNKRKATTTSSVDQKKAKKQQATHHNKHSVPNYPFLQNKGSVVLIEKGQLTDWDYPCWFAKPKLSVENQANVPNIPVNEEFKERSRSPEFWGIDANLLRTPGLIMQGMRDDEYYVIVKKKRDDAVVMYKWKRIN